jgi:hypothetical protein
MVFTFKQHSKPLKGYFKQAEKWDIVVDMTLKIRINFWTIETCSCYVD